MKKGIIVAITVVICAVLAATYAFAAPAKARKSAKTEPTAAEKKEVTTTEKEKTIMEATTESKKAAIEEETAEEGDTDQKPDDSEKITYQEKNEPKSDSEDDEEIDDEEMDHCNHEWVQTGYAADPDFQTGYAIEQECKKCHLCKGIEISQEEFEEATKEDQESYADEGCEYEDSEDAEVVE